MEINDRKSWWFYVLHRICLDDFEDFDSMIEFKPELKRWKFCKFQSTFQDGLFNTIWEDYCCKIDKWGNYYKWPDLSNEKIVEEDTC